MRNASDSVLKGVLVDASSQWYLHESALESMLECYQWLPTQVGPGLEFTVAPIDFRSLLAIRHMRQDAHNVFHWTTGSPGTVTVSARHTCCMAAFRCDSTTRS